MRMLCMLCQHYYYLMLINVTWITILDYLNNISKREGNGINFNLVLVLYNFLIKRFFTMMIIMDLKLFSALL